MTNGESNDYAKFEIHIHIFNLLAALCFYKLWGEKKSFPEKANKNKVLVLMAALTCSCWPCRCSRRKKMGVAASPSSGLRLLPSKWRQCPCPGGVKWWQHRWAEQYLTLKLLHLQAAVFLFSPSPEGSRRRKHLIFFFNSPWIIWKFKWMRTTLVSGHLRRGSHSQKASAKCSFTLCERSKVPASFLCIYAWPQCVPWELIKTNLPVARPSVMGSGASLRKVTCLNRDSRGAAWKVFPLEGLSLTRSRRPLGSERGPSPSQSMIRDLNPTPRQVQPPGRR